MSNEDVIDKSQVQMEIKAEKVPLKTWGEECLEDFGYTGLQLIAGYGFECKDITVGEKFYGKAFSSKKSYPKSSSFIRLEKSIDVYDTRLTLVLSRYKRIPREMMWGGPPDEEFRPEHVEFTVFNPTSSSAVRRAELTISSLDDSNCRYEAEISIDGKGQVTTKRLAVDKPDASALQNLAITKDNEKLVLFDKLGFSYEQLRAMDADMAAKAFLKSMIEGLSEGPIFDPQLLRTKGDPGLSQL